MSIRLATLKEIQSIDREIHKRNKSKKDRPAALAKDEAELAKRRSAFEAKQKELKSLRAEADAKEKQDLKEIEEKILKFNGQLNQAKNNKEYAALTTEINSCKADKGKVEEQVVALMNKVDAFTTECDEVKKGVDESDKSLEVARRAVEADISEINKALAELQGKRAELAAKVDAELLKTYDRIQKHKPDGVALVPVVRDCCQGCNMELTAQDVNMLMRDKDTVLCRSCNRIVYLEAATT